MSLTPSDLQHIEAIFDRKLEPVLGKLEAIENYIKDFYEMIFGLQHGANTDKDFRKLPPKERLLIINAELIAAAKELGVTLPRP